MISMLLSVSLVISSTRALICLKFSRTHALLIDGYVDIIVAVKPLVGDVIFDLNMSVYLVRLIDS